MSMTNTEQLAAHEKYADTVTYDVIVIGGGAIGENLADRAVRGGLSAVVIEEALVGGECSYWACMPSKALLRPGAALAAARAVPGAGQVPKTIDRAATLASRTAFTSNWDDASQVEWLEGAGIDLIRGKARITGEREVEVSVSAAQAGLKTVDSGIGENEVIRVRARVAVVLCTGSEPVVPPIEGLAESQPWTSAEATSTDAVPEELLIIGGGVVACEMATAFADLGSRVHLVVREERVLANLDSFVGEAVAKSLKDLGVEIRFNTEVTACVPASGGRGSIEDVGAVDNLNVTTAKLSDGSQLSANQILVATGRKPRLPEFSGVAPRRDKAGNLNLDDDMRVVGCEWLYAVGDASARAHTTHQGKYQARIIGDLIVGRAAATRATGDRAQDSSPGSSDATQPGGDISADLRGDVLGPPQVVFTRPEVAHVGRTADQARNEGIDVRVFHQDLGAIAGAAVHAEGYEGSAQFVVDQEREVLVGVTITGLDTAELLHAATIAIIGQVPLSRLWHAVPAYPTMSEVWLRFLESAGL